MIKIPKITVSINFYENKNQGYLDLALDSLLRQEGVDLEIILVSSALQEPRIPLSASSTKTIRIVNEKRENSASLNCEIGLNMARPESTLLFTTSDDVIHAQYALRNLAYFALATPILINSISNCDNTILYCGSFGVRNADGKELDLKPFMRLQEIKGFEQELMNFPSYEVPFIFRVPYLNMYACMFQRKIWEDVGGFDYTGLKICGEDTDWCIRAEQKGYWSYATPNAFSFHFGGVTTSEGSSADPKKVDAGIKAFKDKWGVDVTQITPQHMGSYNDYIELLALRKKIVELDEWIRRQPELPKRK